MTEKLARSITSIVMALTGVITSIIGFPTAGIVLSGLALSLITYNLLLLKVEK